jgi:hypothetical protein
MVIYKTTNLVNGKQYIGKDTKNDPKYLGSGSILKKAINKYGKENFKKEIIEVCNSENELRIREEYWLNYYDVSNNPMFYNMHNHSYGGLTIENLSEETRNRLSESKRGKKNGFYGRHHTDETKKLLSDKLSGENSPWHGRTHSEITRKKLSQLFDGELNPMFGKKLSEEHRMKISKSMSGRQLSESHKEKLKDINYGKNNPMYGKKLSEDHRLKLSEGQRRWNDANKTREKHTDEHKKKISESIKKWHESKKLERS